MNFFFLSALGGIWCLAPLYLWEHRRLQAILVTLFGGLFFAGVVQLPLPWDWVAGIWVLLNSVSYLIFARLFPLHLQGKTYKRGKGRKIVVSGSIVLLFAIILLSPLVSVLHLYWSDLLYSRHLAVVPDTESVYRSLIDLSFVLVLSHFIARLGLDRYFGRSLNEIPGLLFRGLFLSLALFQLWVVFYQIPIAKTLNARLFSEGEELFRLGILLFSFVVILRLFYRMEGQHRQSGVARYSTILLSCIPFALGLTLVLGNGASWYLALGRYYEHKGEVRQAVSSYDEVVRLVRKEQPRAYLQYHIGLLMRRIGDLRESRAAFQKVLKHFSFQGEISRRSYLYEERLSKADSTSHKRFVIQGIEAATEQKSAYCVPNSLGLVLRFWGKNISPREIGKMITENSKGTYVPDAVFLTELKGLRHLTMPYMGLEHLKSLIMEGFPVLIYVQNHVFAVFGFDELLQTVVTYDVDTYDLWEDMPLEDLLPRWQSGLGSIGLVFPESKVEQVENILGADVTQKSEGFLQYMMWDMESTPYNQGMKHLYKAAQSGLEDARWEWFIQSGEVLEPMHTSLGDSLMSLEGAGHYRVRRYFLYLLASQDTIGAVEYLQSYAREHTLSFQLTDDLVSTLYSLGEFEEASNIAYNSMDEDGLLETRTLFLLAKMELVRQNLSSARELFERIMLLDGVDGVYKKKSYELWKKSGLDLALSIRDRILLIDRYVEQMGCGHPEAIFDLQSIAEGFRFKKPEENRSFQRRLNHSKACLVFRM